MTVMGQGDRVSSSLLIFPSAGVYVWHDLNGDSLAIHTDVVCSKMCDCCGVCPDVIRHRHLMSTEGEKWDP